MTELQTPILFLDFDGTISRRDAVDAILKLMPIRSGLLLKQSGARAESAHAIVCGPRCLWCGRRESRSMHYWTR